MKKKFLFGALFALASLPAFAQSEALSVDEVVAATGMKKAEVLLMLGAKSNNHYYLTSEFRVTRQWADAIRQAGLAVEERRDAEGRIARVVVRSDNKA